MKLLVALDQMYIIYSNGRDLIEPRSKRVMAGSNLNLKGLPRSEDSETPTSRLEAILRCPSGTAREPLMP